MSTTKDHWEKVYETKKPGEVSWTQDVPQTSLNFIHALNLPKSASIIDVGGGDSRLVDYLLNEGFQNITVLDISAKALDKAKERLKDDAQKVKWIVSDVTSFKPERVYDVWHDRATFHFLTMKQQIETYIGVVKEHVSKYLIIATFSSFGPEQCSGLPVSRYSKSELISKFENEFEKMRCMTEDHVTPFNTTQNFLFCCFKKLDKQEDV